MAEKLEQGETYEEAEANDNGESPSNTNQMDKVKIIAIGAVIAFVLIAIGMYGLSRKNAKTENAAEADTFVSDEDAESFTDDFWVEDTEAVMDIEMGSFTTEEIEGLRKWGYTGDEIEFYMNQGVTYESLVESSKELQAKAHESVIKTVNKKAGGTYKKLLNMTWMGGKKLTVKKIADEDADISYETIIENVDYVKCEPRGKQLFIRCTLNDKTNIFMMVPPERWVRMKSKGNIVVEYVLEHYGKYKVITEISEIEQNSMYDSYEE